MANNMLQDPTIILHEETPLTFYHDIELVKEGLLEYKKTGQIPTLDQLTGKESTFRRDVFRLNEELERQKNLRKTEHE